MSQTGAVPTDAPTQAHPNGTRSPEQIEADIARTRESLAGDIDVLQDRLSPASLLQTVKVRAISVLQRSDGSVDPVRVGALAGAVVVLAVYVVRRRRI